MEDLLEVIIGEIRDEHEPSTDIADDGQGGYVVSGNFDLDRVTDLFQSFHREDDIESTTVGGLVSEWLGRVPKPGEFVDRDGVRIEVLASDELRVEQVRISKSQTVAHG
jgi:CBS domain containing-hemolysin-like protein